jgi:DnaJ-domain-containing protein 1
MEPRPLIDEEKMRDAFVGLNQKVHPDRFFNAADSLQSASTDRSALVNRAYQTLKNPRERLKYLLSRETGEEPKETTKASMSIMGYYMDASEVCHEAEQWAKNRTHGGTLTLGPSDKEQAASLRGRLTRLKGETRSLWNEALHRMETLDREWMERTGETRQGILDGLDLLANDLSYIAKLQSLIDQGLLALS